MPYLLKVCRICLDTEVKMYLYDRCYLKQYYEEVMTTRMDLTDGLPNYFCYECTMMLCKFHKFREKCFTGQAVLQQILQNGPISLKSIANIDRAKHKLKSQLDIILLNRKVGTYSVKNKSLTETDKKIAVVIEVNKQNIESYEIMELPKVEEMILIHESDDSLCNATLGNLSNKTIEGLNNDVRDVDALGIKTVSNLNNEMVEDLNNDVNDLDSIRIKTNSSNDTVEDLINERSGNVNAIKHKDEPIIKNEIVFAENVVTNLSTPKTALNSGNKRKVSNITRNKCKKDTKNKPKQFEIKKDIHLDPKNWSKVTLSEEEALKEFKAKAQNPKYYAAAYKCTDCLKGFSEEDMLVRHRKRAHSESNGPAVCRFCKMRFKWQSLMVIHSERHYNKYTCLRCNLVFPLLQSAILHNKYHDGVTWTCKHCGDQFKHMTTYYTHLRIHPSEYVCSLCGGAFVSAIGLRQHKNLKHGLLDNDPNVNESTYCERCDITFETFMAYNEHLLHSTKHVQDPTNDTTQHTSSNTNLTKTSFERRRRPRNFTVCGVCNNKFATFAAYKIHHIAEHKDIPLPKKRVSKTKGMKKDKTKVKETRICEICGATVTVTNFKHHINRHTRAKLYPCETCGKEFVAKANWYTHQLTHSSVKPSKCPLCDKRFKQSSSMHLHYRTFHLKEPYPKRNRKKKGEAIPNMDDFLREN